ncbi:MAG: DUF2937 family protein [Pseudomonadota bacterium]
MIRILAFIGGLAGGVGLSQFPEYSQQYLQRLAGAVDELHIIVANFDADAERSQLTRDEALATYANAGGFLAEQGEARAEEIRRFEVLRGDYAALREAEPLQRLAQVYRLADTELASRTWDDFRPAVPVTMDGFICAGIGFAAVWVTIMLALVGIVRLFRRLFRQRAAAADADA